MSAQTTPATTATTATTTTTKGLNVSLEPHLRVTLTATLNLLPQVLKVELSGYVADPPKSFIAHELLHKISLWSRTTDGASKLHSNSLNPQDYSMVSLLAGTATSPEKSFGDHNPPKDPEVQAADNARERKAITALVNSLFSIFGAGFAAWWGADKTGWRDEYKVLFALGVGIVVAISEGVLFLIWSSRRVSARVKKSVDVGDKTKNDVDLIQQGTSDKVCTLKVSSHQEDGSTLRKRRH